MARTKGAKDKQTLDVKELAQDYTADAVSILATIMKDAEEAAPARVAAAKELLDRGHGKPKQTMDVDANVKATVTQVVRTLVRSPHTDS